MDISKPVLDLQKWGPSSIQMWDSGPTPFLSLSAVWQCLSVGVAAEYYHDVLYTRILETIMNLMDLLFCFELTSFLVLDCTVAMDSDAEKYPEANFFQNAGPLNLWGRLAEQSEHSSVWP